MIKQGNEHSVDSLSHNSNRLCFATRSIPFSKRKTRSSHHIHTFFLFHTFLHITDHLLQLNAAKDIITPTTDYDLTTYNIKKKKYKTEKVDDFPVKCRLDSQSGPLCVAHLRKRTRTNHRHRVSCVAAKPRHFYGRLRPMGN